MTISPNLQLLFSHKSEFHHAVENNNCIATIMNVFYAWSLTNCQIRRNGSIYKSIYNINKDK